MEHQLKNRKAKRSLYATLLLLLLMTNTHELFAQAPATHRILVDIGHGQRFWNDPAAMERGASQLERVKYMTDQLKKTAASVKAEIGYVKEKIQPSDLATCDLLFIHIPSSPYSPSEVEAIKRYLQEGGGLFIAMDADYWSTLEQVNVNDIISPFGIKYGPNSSDTLSGGYTKASPVTKNKLKIAYHGGRMVTGGTPFCYNNQTEEYPFGTSVQIKDGGKIVVMGDGMVSLYMTSWKDVHDYQCGEFMQEVFAWLLR